jgi:hypothetical protein
VTAEIVEDDDVALGERRDEHLLDIWVKSSPLIGPSMTHGASTRSERKAAMKVSVFQWPCGTRASRRRPRGPQPRRGAMLVLTQVSSMKTSRPGSIRS